MARNTVLCHSGDNLLVWLLIWSLLLPLGAVASVDSRAPNLRARTRPRDVFSIGSVALLMQIVLRVFGRGHFPRRTRLGPASTARSTVFWQAISGLRLGSGCRGKERVTQVLNVATLVLEGLGPALALLCAPWPLGFAPQSRESSWCSTCAWAPTLYVGTFAFVCYRCVAAVCSRPTWDWLDSRVVWREAARGWGRLLDLLASVIEAAARSLASVAGVKENPLRPALTTSYIGGALLAYVTLVNLLIDAPPGMVPGRAAKLSVFGRSSRPGASCTFPECPRAARVWSPNLPMALAPPSSTLNFQPRRRYCKCSGHRSMRAR
jgi:hypothetical protein